MTINPTEDDRQLEAWRSAHPDWAKALKGPPDFVPGYLRGVSMASEGRAFHDPSRSAPLSPNDAAALEWYTRKAVAEGDHEVAAGSPSSHVAPDGQTVGPWFYRPN